MLLLDMRKHIVKLLFSSGTTFLLISLGFYFFILKPKLELPSTLLEAETAIAENHLNLVQNRLSIMDLARLDPYSLTLSTEKEELLNTALATNTAGLEEVVDTSGVKKIIGKTSEAIAVNNEIAEVLPSLLDQNVDILQRQEDLLTKLTSIAEINSNIFKYNPGADLGQLHPIQDKEKIIERASSALLGLNDIRFGLEDSFGGATADKMVVKLEEAGLLFQNLIKTVEEEDVPGAGKLFDDIATQFIDMREIGLEMELSIIRSPEILELLKDQTNLLLEYEYWLEKLDMAQKTISSETVEPILNINF
mgnify:FL=1|jgi:hypothetical protein